VLERILSGARLKPERIATRSSLVVVRLDNAEASNIVTAARIVARYYR